MLHNIPFITKQALYVMLLLKHVYMLLLMYLMDCF